jgi:hypothetical protein
MVWKTKINSAILSSEQFFSVFLSTVLTLISLGFFIRIGWILGTTTLTTTFAVIALAIALTLTTAASLSLILSNIKEEAHSLHFLLSRSFGSDVAYAIGAPLFLAQALSSTFYLAGTIEVLHLLLPSISTKILSSLCFFTLFFISKFFFNALVKLEGVLFVLICATLLSFYLKQEPFQKELSLTFSSNHSIWQAFAIFFPIVAGIESTLNSIRSSSKNYKPFSLGIFSGILVSVIFYITLVFVLYQIAEVDELKSNTLILKKISIYPPLAIGVILFSGFIGAWNSLSSACYSLESFCQHTSIPSIFRLKTNQWLITIALVGLGLLFGSLNHIAPLLSLFFLISYGTINLAVGLEAWIENPSFRPSIKIHFMIPLFGAILSFIIIVMINPGFGLISALIISLLYWYIKTTKLNSSWEDFRYSLLLFLSRWSLYKLNSLHPSPRTWRPNLLVFINDPAQKESLTKLSGELTQKKGFLICSSIVSKDQNKNILFEKRRLDLLLSKQRIPALVKIKEASDVLGAIESEIEETGLGAFSPNTIVLGASENQDKFLFFSKIIKIIYQKKKNLVLIRERSKNIKTLSEKNKRIDIWWGGKNRSNSELMIILSYMLQKNPSWKGSTLSLKTAISKEEEAKEIRDKVETFMHLARIQFETEIILHKKGNIFETTIKHSSKDADLIFLGIKAPDDSETVEQYGEYFQQVMEKTSHFPSIAYVLASEEIDFRKILT